MEFVTQKAMTLTWEALKIEGKHRLSPVGTISKNCGDCCSIGLTVESLNNVHVVAQTQDHK